MVGREAMAAINNLKFNNVCLFLNQKWVAMVATEAEPYPQDALTDEVYK